MQLLKTLTPLALLGLASGCATRQDYKPTGAAPNVPAASRPVTPSLPPPPSAMGAAGAAGALTATPKWDTKIASLEKQGGAKAALAAAYAERGYARMMDDAASPRVKYRMALRDFRRALALDPANQKAKKNKVLIEDIYKSMGRPIPAE